MVKNLPANAGDVRDTGSIPGSGRSPGKGNGNTFQYSCLENPMDRGAWQSTVHGVNKVGCNLAHTASLVVPVVKNPPADARYIRDVDLIPGSGRSPGGGHGNLLQYSCL